MSVPTIDAILPNDPNTISIIQHKATEKGLELLTLINTKAKWVDKKASPDAVDEYLQIATSESLTSGLIMSTLVDIPWAGFAKYGGFMVYDPDAKRVFNNVQIDNLYTHKCASEMAIGVLKNSNATIAIAVTGNAMPLNEHVDQVGEVFIGIAGYNASDEIIFETTVVNVCNIVETDPELAEFKETCSKWYSKIKGDTTGKTYNSRDATATISKEIRYYTAFKAYEQCIKFITERNPSIPKTILDRKAENAKKNEQNYHTSIPGPRFDFGGLGKCIKEDEAKCTTPEEGSAPYTLPTSARGGRRSKKPNQNKRSIRKRSYKRRK
jgi:PncC family amidohydrolase